MARTNRAKKAAKRTPAPDVADAPRGWEALVAYLGRRGWPFEPLDDRALALTRPIPDGFLDCVAHVEEGYFAFRSLYPFLVPEGKRPRLAQFVALANCRTPVGALDLDLADGVIGFRTGLAVGRDDLTPALVEAVVEPNLAAAGRWLPGAAAVSFSDVGPPAAVEQCLRAFSIAEIVALAGEMLDADER